MIALYITIGVFTTIGLYASFVTIKDFIYDFQRRNDPEVKMFVESKKMFVVYNEEYKERAIIEN